MKNNEKKAEIPIDGMHCASCALNIENSLKKVDGVKKIEVNLNLNKANLEYDSDKVSISDIDKSIEDLGFKVRKSEATLKIGGMHCANCVLTVEKKLKKLNGVSEAIVNLNSENALVYYDKNLISIDEIGKAIEEAGFDYLGKDSKSDSELEEKQERQYNRDLKDKRNRIIIGFVFSGILMGIMFTDIHMYISQHVKWLSMSLLSLLIAIVPFIYVSYPIIKAGFNALIHKNLNMDLMYTMGILVAFISSLLGTFNIILDSSFMFYETAIMLSSFLLLGRYLEAQAKKKTSSSIKQLIGLQPKTATLLVKNSKDEYTEKEILIEDITIDDLLLVRPGDKIPADGTVIDGNSYVEESMITGEPIAVLKTNGEDVFSGTINQDCVLKIKAQKIGKETVLSQIIDLVEKAQSSKPPVQKIADRVVQYFIPTLLTIAILSFLIWYLIVGSSLLFALTILISILVVACPCALGLATPTAVTVGIGRAAEYGILIKNGETLESLNGITHAIFDKTGTITEGNPEVVDIFTFNQEIGEDKIIELIASLENNSTHPIAKAIVKKANERNIDLCDVDNFESVQGKGLKGKISGKCLLAGNKTFLEEEKILKTNDHDLVKKALKTYENFISTSKTAIFLVYNSSIVGIVTLMDKVRYNSKMTIEELKSRGISTLMLTGDNKQTASSVADLVGVDNFKAEVLPNEKLDEVIAIQENGGKVLFVGDGINDAPAISQADVGIALGSGTDVAMESGDIVLMEGNLENVLAAIQFSNKVMTRIKENIFWAFIYNIILIPIAAGLLYPLFNVMFRPELAGLAMALSSVTVISLSLTLKRFIPPNFLEKSLNKK